jgi:hypothetical protein
VQLDELIANGARVMVTVRIPGVEAHRIRAANERNYDVLTVRDGHIVAIRACRDRVEALAVAGISLSSRSRNTRSRPVARVGSCFAARQRAGAPISDYPTGWVESIQGTISGSATPSISRLTTIGS